MNRRKLWCRGVECLFLTALLLFLFVGVGRSGITASSVIALKLGVSPSWLAVGDSTPPRARGVFRTWWGARQHPMGVGGDYLAVLNLHGDRRTVGNAFATLLERQRTAGHSPSKLVIPVDLESYGASYGSGSLRRADGSTIDSERHTYYISAINRQTAVPIVEQSYDPIVSGDVVQALTLRRHPIGSEHTVWITELVPADGVYVLYLDDEAHNTYLIPSASLEAMEEM